MIYSSDLRQRVLVASDGPLTNQQVADLFQVSTGTVERWRRQRRETGQISAGKSTGRPRAIPSDRKRCSGSRSNSCRMRPWPITVSSGPRRAGVK